MKISENGINFIKKHEGLFLTAYDDGVGICTIGYGHTGQDVYYGETITEQKAEELLRNDLQRFENCINKLNIHLNQNQFDALVSFTYNVGEGGVAPDKQVGKYLREGNYPKACESMLKWCNGGGHFIQGLYNRRLDEVKLFNSGEKTNLNVNQNNNLYGGEFFEMSKTFKNGKTSEIIWTNNLHENKVGYLNAFEECKCLAIHESGHAIVLYTGINNYDKVGFTTCHCRLCDDGVVRPID